uniref:Ferritin n=1 Tax=Pelusios castaneus TaxID=367368 RepID=A0A8C8REI9_9SAUR
MSGTWLSPLLPNSVRGLIQHLTPRCKHEPSATHLALDGWALCSRQMDPAAGLGSLLLTFPKRRMESQVRQNFHADCEAAVNRVVNLELYASYVYLSLSYYFDRDDVALKHMAQFLKEQSHEEREHAEKFLKYQNKRGGRIVLQDIKKPERDEWGNSLEALQCALQLEKTVNQALLDLHGLATEHNDPHLCDFLESDYLEEQVKAIKQLGDDLTNLKLLGVPQNGLGEYLFDKHTLGNCKKRNWS